MPTIEQIKQKYEAAFRVMDQQKVRVQDAHSQEGKLYIRAEAPSQDAKNKVWDQIKAIDPGYGDLICDIRIAGEEPSTESRFDELARSAPPSSIARGLSAAFRSDQTPPFGQMLGRLFGQSNPDQKAGLLNSLLAASPAALAAEVAGMFGSKRQLTPQEAQQVSPEKLQELATKAEKDDPSIVDRASEFYAQHPNLVKTLGVGALTFAVSQIVGGMRGRGSGS
jgi:hypothetical protein